MEFRVLGPVEVRHGGQSLRMARRQQRIILGVLALEVNQAISRDSLVDYLWPSAVPERATAVVQSRVSELRAILGRVLGPDEDVHLLTTGDAYMLESPPGRIDAHRFRAAMAAERDLSTVEGAQETRRTLRDALDLWRGPVLGGALPDSALSELGQSLEAARITALEDLFDAELRLGSHQLIADEAASASAANPTRERLAEQAMLALYRAGRQAEALQAYEQRRRWLRNELGTDPDAASQRLHLSILQNDSAIQATPADPVVSQDEQPASTTTNNAQQSAPSLGLGHPAADRFQASVPHTLPADVPDFTGRTSQRAWLSHVLGKSGQNSGRVVAISGRGGIGKSALALQTAHALSEHYPDGQLYLDLRGFDSKRPVDPCEALTRLLMALGVDGSVLPNDVESRTDLYRDLLFDKSILIVLDNAASVGAALPVRRGTPAGPAPRISRVIRSRPTRRPSISRRSAWILGAP